MNRFKKKLLAIFFLVLPLSCAAAAQTTFDLRSPNKKIELRIRTADRIAYDVVLNGVAILQDCTLALNVDHQNLGKDPKVLSSKENSVDQILEPVVRQKFAKIHENYNEVRITMDGGYAVVFRAYNEGVAYRFETSLPAKDVKVYAEEVNFNFAQNDIVYYPLEDSFYSHNERKFLPQRLRAIVDANIASLPAVVDVGQGAKVAIAESGVEEYPGLWLHGTAGTSLLGTFSPYPLKEKQTSDRDYRIVEAADYIAVTSGTRVYPWRLLGIVDRDADLLTNQLVWLLEKPSQLQDTSWIKPGKVAWDWWNANNIYGVDFKAGINTQTYKYYIDFAAKYNLQYIILDEGWYKIGNCLEVVPEINMEELSAYAKEKNVGIILWLAWKTLDDQLIPALDLYAKWGVKGVKVDFMQRDDQLMVNFYHKVSSETAKRHMLVDFHGNAKPAILTRTWPNLISTEGVRGMEWNKWSGDAEPKHTVTLPFTRMFLGPMDFTPGAMRNASKNNFAPIFAQPMSPGTRCNQLAMYVVYESPLQMLSDSPSNYMREPESMEFLSAVPTVWDDTKVLDGKISEYVLVARRSGNDWYVGAMTDWTAREMEVDFSFLPQGTFWLEAYQDGVNADRYGSDYKKIKMQVTSATKLKISLASGGGWAAHLHP
jgi:alpha-glucosidase